MLNRFQSEKSLKRILLFIVVILGFSINCQAQNYLKVGIGPSISRWWHKFDSGSYNDLFKKPLITPSIYVGADVFQKNHIAVDVNLASFSRGGKEFIEYSFGGEVTKIVPQVLRLDYFSMNSRLSYYFRPYRFKSNQNFVSKPFAYVGVRGDRLYRMNSIAEDYDFVWRMNRWMFGVIVGGGVSIPFNNFEFGLDLMYHVNVIPISSRQYFEWDSHSIITNNRISSLTFQPMFQLKYFISE